MSVVTQPINNVADKAVTEQAKKDQLRRRLTWFLLLWFLSVIALAVLVWPLRWLFSSLIGSS